MDWPAKLALWVPQRIGRVIDIWLMADRASSGKTSMVFCPGFRP